MRWTLTGPRPASRIACNPPKMVVCLLGVVLWCAALLGVPSRAMSAVSVQTIPLTTTSMDRSVTGGVFRTISLSTPAEMVGARWQGSADHIDIRIRQPRGSWGPWITLGAEVDEGPDTSATEFQGSSIHRVPTPLWVGHARVMMVRVPTGTEATHLRLVVVHAPRQRGDTNVYPAIADPRTAIGRQPTPPTVQTRAQWGADESIRRAAPSYADQVVAAVVHHTVNGNTYAREDVPAIIRGIYAYHVKSNGWNDIGYNFLVDRFGRVWEGRYGGITKAVIGAHTGGFNTRTTGMALIGDFSSTTVAPAARTALIQLISWRLNLEHVDPTQSVTLTSGGNGKWAAGTLVRARNVGGHRDLYATSCPGSSAYSMINRIRTKAWSVGGPKIAGVSAAHQLAADGTPTSLRVQAHANMQVAWKLTMTRISTGATLAELRTSGSSFDVTWDGSGAAGTQAWDIRWTLTAVAEGTTARPVSRRVATSPPVPTLTLRARSAPIATPNGDGRDDVGSATVSLAATARVRVSIEAADGVPGTTLRTVTNRVRSAGTFTVSWDGTDALGAPLPDGPYLMKFVAEDSVASRPDQTLTIAIGIDRTIRMLPVVARFSPNHDGVLDTVTVRTNVDPVVSNGSLALRTQRGVLIRQYSTDAALHGPVTTILDGTVDGTTRIPDGPYVLILRAEGRPAGTVVIRQPIIIDGVLQRCTARRRADGRLVVVTRERTRIRATIRRGSSTRTVTRWFAAGRHVTDAFPSVRHVMAMDEAYNSAVIRVTS